LSFHQVYEELVESGGVQVELDVDRAQGRAGFVGFGPVGFGPGEGVAVVGAGGGVYVYVEEAVLGDDGGV
jgi:hypothetical protein